MSQKIAVVDIDGTLVPESNRLRAQAEAVMPFFQTTDTQEFVYRFFEVNDYVAKHEPDHKNDIPYYMDCLAKKYEVQLNSEQVELATTAWQKAYDESNAEIVAFPGASEFMKTLKDRGYEVIVASGNSRESRERMLSETGLGQYVDGLLAAKETGFQKQQAEFWEVLYERFPYLGTAEHIVMVGNQLNDDALHPSRLGMKVFIVKWPGELDKVRFGADSAVSIEAIQGAREKITMTAESLQELLTHPQLQ
jgi:FMN phosphatase YigB (HAD superfamily)